MFRRSLLGLTMVAISMPGAAAPAAGDGLARAEGVDQALSDRLITYRGDLSFRGVPMHGAIDLEFRLFATDEAAAPLAEPVVAHDWPVNDGVVLVGLDFGAGVAVPDEGAWLEIAVDGVILSPRQFIPPQGWSMRGSVKRGEGRPALAIENDFDPDATDQLASDQLPSEHLAADATRLDDSPREGAQPGEAARDARDGDAARRTPRLERGGAIEAMESLDGERRAEARDDRRRGNNGGDDNGTGDDGHENFLYAAGDRFISATDSVYINIDSDNTDPDTRVFEIGKNRGGDAGGDTLFRLFEGGGAEFGGGVDIAGGTTVSGPAHFFSNLRADGQVEINAGVDIFGNVDIEGDLAVTGFRLDSKTQPGFVLTSDSSGNASWQAPAPPSGAASGDLAGSYPNPHLATLATSLAKVSGGAMMSGGDRIGIGTATPSQLLHVVNTGSTFSRAIHARSTSSGGTLYGVFGESDSITGAGVRGQANHATGGNAGVWGETLSSGGTAVFARSLAGSGTNYGVRAQVSSAAGYAGHFSGGRNYFQNAVGVGTLNPAADVEIRPPSGNADLLLRRTDATHGFNLGANATRLFVSYSDGSTFDDHLAITDGGLVGINTTNPSSTLHVVGEGLFTDGIKPGDAADTMSILDSAIDAPASLDIDAASNLTVDATTTLRLEGATVNLVGQANASIQAPTVSITGLGTLGIGGSNGGFTLGVNGTAAKPGGGSWSVLSDERLKREVRPLERSLDTLLRLHGVTFEYIDGASALASPGRHTGFLAQEVERVIPEWVHRGEDGYLSIGVTGFEAMAVEALRDLRAEKDCEVARLRAENADLRSRLEAIERALAELQTRPSNGDAR
jgi:hypothetical protein